MPENFCLDENYEECVQQLRSVRLRLSESIEEFEKRGSKTKRRLPSFLDFATIKRCTPSAALVLAAEYDRARTMIPSNIRLINLDHWRKDLVRLLDEIGFFNLLNIARPRLSETGADVTVVPFKTGVTFGNNEAGSLMGTLAQMVVNVDPAAADDPLTFGSRLRLYAALVEACENARRHAYPETSGVDKRVRRWWMTGAIHRADKRLTLAVYDQGVTIPANLPGWEGYPWIKRAFRRLLGTQLADGDPKQDAVALRLAMDAPRSSTGLEHRGKGFPVYKEVIKECNRGRLRIVSRHGEFIYEKGRRPAGRQLVTALDGTLVEWDLWL
jgi:hypothetical protein